MINRGNVYDFPDFEKCISSANCTSISMSHEDFQPWKSCANQYKLRQLNPRVYLADMAQVEFQRNSRNLFYKNSFKIYIVPLEFLMTSFNKDECPASSIKPRGIDKNKIDIIIEKLVRPMMPQPDMHFGKV